MNVWMLWLVTLCYAGTGIDFCFRGQYAWGIFWASYAVANTAFMIATRVPHP